jgi:hypothetical protein
MNMSNYPVTFDVTKPERFDRSQVFLRLVILIVVSILGAFAWLIALIYVVIPVLSAAFISRDGSDKFISDTAVGYKRYLHWIASADAYFTLLTDKIPLDGPEVASTMEVKIGGRPTTGSALLRLLTSIPSGFVLALFGVVATITGIIAGIFILVREDYPETLYGLHTGVVRWGARLLAYHASLTDEYPPFSLDTRHRDEPRAMPQPGQPT